MAAKQKIAAKYSCRGNIWSPSFPQRLWDTAGNRVYATCLWIQLTDHLHSGALAAQRTLVQLIQWLLSELCGMPNTTQVSGMGSVKIQKDGTWKSMRALPEPLLNPLQKGRMISLKSFLFLTYDLCVHWVYLFCEQSETPVKACHNIYLDQIIQCVLSLQSIVLLLLTYRHATYHFLLTDIRHLAFWRFGLFWGGRGFFSRCLIVQTS